MFFLLESNNIYFFSMYVCLRILIILYHTSISPIQPSGILYKFWLVGLWECKEHVQFCMIFWHGRHSQLKIRQQCQTKLALATKVRVNGRLTSCNSSNSFDTGLSENRAWLVVGSIKITTVPLVDYVFSVFSP